MPTCNEHSALVDPTAVTAADSASQQWFNPLSSGLDCFLLTCTGCTPGATRRCMNGTARHSRNTRLVERDEVTERQTRGSHEHSTNIAGSHGQSQKVAGVLIRISSDRARRAGLECGTYNRQTIARDIPSEPPYHLVIEALKAQHVLYQGCISGILGVY